MCKKNNDSKLRPVVGGYPLVVVNGNYKLVFWMDNIYSLEALVESEASIQTTTKLWLANTMPCSLPAHPYDIVDMCPLMHGFGVGD